MPSIILGREVIDSEKDNVFIIAEIGQNHQGCIIIAKRMILEAKKAGCNCVKFQKSNLLSKFTQKALNRTYCGPNSWSSTYGEHKEFLEFSDEQYLELQSFCKDLEIYFTASAMDELSLKFLNELDVPFIKIGSGDADNFPLLIKASKLVKPLVISTGMQQITIIDKIVNIMKEAGKKNFALLHCTSAYPTLPKDCNLQLITLLKRRYPDVVIGYSGHEEGIKISKASVLCGARILERHITLDKRQKGSDHKCSLEPIELKQLVSDIREFRLVYHELNKKILSNSDILNILGRDTEITEALRHINEKKILPCEWACKQKLGKSIVAAVNLTAGKKLEKMDLAIKVSEPNGISAHELFNIIGIEILRDVKEDEPIMYEYLNNNSI